jgi:hypothetical protein
MPRITYRNRLQVPSEPFRDVKVYKTLHPQSITTRQVKADGTTVSLGIITDSGRDIFARIKGQEKISVTACSNIRDRMFFDDNVRNYHSLARLPAKAP